MSRRRHVLLAGLVITLTGPAALVAQRPDARSAQIDTVLQRRVQLPYVAYFPPGYADSARAWPLVLFLHGAGERGRDLRAMRTQGLPKLAESRALPFVLVVPQVAPDEVWSTDALLALRIDPARVYLTGLSMGAFGAWDLATTAPERFAALVAISGGGNPVPACRLRSTPVWLVHGQLDDVIPVEESQVLARRLAACGAPVRLTIYPDAGHDAWTRTYEGPEFLEWLLAQRRPEASRRASVSLP
jgi:predicted peptidase